MGGTLARTRTQNLGNFARRGWAAILALGLFMGLSLMNASSASAYVGPNLLRNWENGQCLDSNRNGQVYMGGCSTGNDYQTWIPHFARHTSSDVVQLQNKATGRCLRFDINFRLRTDSCLGSDGLHAGLWNAVGSSWNQVKLQSTLEPGLCVTNHASLHSCVNAGSQLWKLGF